jgi:PAS domain S-box-containing protein
MMNVLGYMETEIYQVNIIVTHEDDIISNEKIRTVLRASLRKPIVMEKSYVHKYGHIIYGFFCVQALLNDNGKATHLVSQVIDISYRKEVENSAYLFRAMMNALRDTMLIVIPV